MQAIVLARQNFREFDQIISLYTRERGKVELLAKGVKKPVSKNSPHLERFSHILVESVIGRELMHLTTAQTIRLFSGIRQDVEKIIAACVATAWVDNMTEVGERDERLFRLIHSWLSFLDTASYRSIFLDGFFIGALSCFGFAPSMEACVVCDTPFQKMAFEKSALYFAGGGIICPSCRKIKEAVGEEMRECTLRDVSNIQLLAKCDWRLLERYPVSSSEAARLHALVYAFTIYHSERQLADWGNMWYCMVGMPR